MINPLQPYTPPVILYSTMSGNFAGSNVNLASIVLTKGFWLILGTCGVNNNGTTAPGNVLVDISLTSAANDANYRAQDSSGLAVNKSLTLAPRFLFTEGQTVYAVGTVGSITGGPPTILAGQLIAIRLSTT